MEQMKSIKLKSTALIVMSSIVLSRLTGFLREILIPNVFESSKADAYNMAFKLTGLMYDMMVGGAIAAALIPVLSGYLAKNEEEEGWKAAGTFINVIVIAAAVACTAGMIFTKQVVGVLALGFKGEVTQDTVEVARILFPSVTFLMMTGLINGVLNSYNRFAAAAYGPSIYNIGSALSILLLGRYGITHAACGVMASAVIYFIFQLCFAFRNLKHYRFKIYLRHPGFVRLFKLAIPSLLSSSITQVNVIVSLTLVSFFPEGSITAFNMADRIWQMPYGVFAQGMGIAMLPSLSAELATGHVQEYKDTLLKGLKTVIFLTIPSAIGFLVLRTQIISAFKFTGVFDDYYIKIAGEILMFFSIALISQSLVTVLNRSYYANNDTKTPLYIGSTAILINICLGILFLKKTSLGAAGMALSYSIASIINATLLITILNYKMKGIHLKKLAAFALKTLTAAVIMGTVVYLATMAPVNTYSKVVQLAFLLFEIGLGFIIYFAIAIIIGIEEAKTIKNNICNKMYNMIKYSK